MYIEKKVMVEEIQRVLCCDICKNPADKGCSINGLHYNNLGNVYAVCNNCYKEKIECLFT